MIGRAGGRINNKQSPEILLQTDSPLISLSIKLPNHHFSLRSVDHHRHNTMQDRTLLESPEATVRELGLKLGRR